MNDNLIADISDNPFMSQAQFERMARLYYGDEMPATNSLEEFLSIVEED